MTQGEPGGCRALQNSMRWNDIPEPRKHELLRIYEYDIETGSQRLLKQPEATQMNCVATLKRRLRDFREQIRVEIEIPPSPSPILDDWMEIETDNAIVLSDFEVPDHHREILKRATLMGQRYNIRTLVIAGDGHAGDQAALTYHPILRPGGEGYRSSVELLKEVLRAFNKQFDNIYYISGNHDRRAARMTSGEIDLGHFLTDLDFVHYSAYSKMWVKTRRGWVFIPHQVNFSKNPVTIGQDLYKNKARKGHHIIPHCHRQQSGRTEDDAYEIHAIGTCRDARRTQYRQMTVTKHAEWNVGFLMIRNAYFYPMTLKGTDWHFWLGEELFQKIDRSYNVYEIPVSGLSEAI